MIIKQDRSSEKAKVNAERNRRIQEDFVFNGTAFDNDLESKIRIIGGTTLAGFAIAAGAQPDDYLWHGGADPFVWVAKDNSLVTMDAQTCFAFGQAAAAHETNLIFKAKSIKDSKKIPENVKDDKYWNV